MIFLFFFRKKNRLRTIHSNQEMFLLDGSKQCLARLSLLTKDMISKIDGHVLLYQAFLSQINCGC
jgi:hypothetical protein